MKSHERSGRIALLWPKVHNLRYPLLALGLLVSLHACESVVEPPPPEPQFVLEGRFLTEDGTGIPGVLVELERDQTIWSAVTDDVGRYRFSDLVAGQYTLRFVPPEGMTAEALAVMVRLPEDGTVHDFVLSPLRAAELHAIPGSEVSAVLGSGVRAKLRNESSETIRIELLDLSEVPAAAVPGALYPVQVRTLSAPGTAASVPVASETEPGGIFTLEFPFSDNEAGLDVVLRLAKDLYELAFPLNTELTTVTDPSTGEQKTFLSIEVEEVEAMSPFDPLLIAIEYKDTTCGSEAYQLSGPAHGPAVGDRLPVILIHGWQATRTTCRDFADDEFDVRDHLSFYADIIESDSLLRDGTAVFTYRYPTFVDIHEPAQVLSAFIADRGWDEVALLAHSRGGLVGRVAAKMMEQEGSRTLITVGSPHNGALIADQAREAMEWLLSWRRSLILRECSYLLTGLTWFFPSGYASIIDNLFLDQDGMSHMTAGAVSLLPWPSARTRAHLLGSFVGNPAETEFSKLIYCMGHLWYREYAREPNNDGIVETISSLRSEMTSSQSHLFVKLDHGHLLEGRLGEDDALREAIRDALLAALFPIEVEITLPIDGGTYQQGKPILFEGSAVTVEGIDLSDEALVWRSDKDGVLGTGEGVTRSDLSTGKHTIMLEATDSYGAVRSASVQLEVAHFEALSGRVIDQFTSTPIPGVTVTSTEGSVTTDASGRFAVAVASPDDGLVFSGSNIHTRRTFGQGSDLDWRVIPADFDMDLFDEVARRLGDLIDVAQNDRTHKWTGGSPEVFIDTRNYGYAPGVLPQEVGSHVAAYIDRWSAGTVSPAQVTVTDSPPADGTVGTIVIRFVDLSDLKTEEDGETIWALGLTHPWAYWDRFEIVAGVIELDLVSSGLDMDPELVVGRELGHIFGMGQFHRNRPMMMREVTPPPGTPFSAFEAAVAHIVYSRLSGTRSPDTEEKVAAAPAPPAPSQPVGRPILNRVRVR